MRNINCYIKLFMSYAIILFTIFNSSPLQALTVLKSVDDAILCIEAYPNIAFHTFGFKNITNASYSNTASSMTDTTLIVSSNLAFTIDGLAYSGPGTWESIKGFYYAIFGPVLKDKMQNMQRGIYYDIK